MELQNQINIMNMNGIMTSLNHSSALTDLCEEDACTLILANEGIGLQDFMELANGKNK